MIYIFIFLIIILYFFVLFTRSGKDVAYIDNKLAIILSSTLTIFLIYMFSLSFNAENTDEYKKIHSKNLSIRSNIKTIKENIPILESNLSQKPDDFNGWLMLGKSYSILNNYHKASRAYQTAINLSPDNTDVIREFILVLRSDSEIINQDLIKKYFNIYYKKTKDYKALIDMLSFSFSINDNFLAQNTLEKIIKHPDIKNKNQYKELLVQLKNNAASTIAILNLNIKIKKIYGGFFFMILKKPDSQQPFAIKRLPADKREYLVKFTNSDFMINKTEIPNNFDIIIKHSLSEKFSDENRPVTVFEKKIQNYEGVKGSPVKVNF
tara:strand:+ start:3683 stop:4648 length:966 start_codon:yes stop_codon:yes gene_type:complete